MRRKYRRQRNFDGRRISPLAIIQLWASYLSEIETDKKAGSIAVLKRLAAALGVTVVMSSPKDSRGVRS
jgi:transcriptional regulator with XRE-family HTH domain